MDQTFVCLLSVSIFSTGQRGWSRSPLISSCPLNLPPDWPDIHPHSRNLVKDYLKSHPACVEAVWLIFDKRAFTCQQNKYLMEGPTVKE